MRLVKFSLLTFLWLFFANCSKGDTPEVGLSPQQKKEKELEEANEEIYFSYVLPGFYNTNNAWLIIHDLEGNLIDYISLSDKSFYELTATKNTVPERFNVTILSADLNSNTSGFHRLFSYTNIEKGSFWYENRRTASGSRPPADGNWNLRVTNIPNIKNFNVFGPAGSINSINDNIETELDGSKTLVLDRVFLIQAEGEYLININDFNGEVKYIKVLPENSFDTIEVDYADFVAFDSYIEKELPAGSSHLFYTAGFKEDNPNFYQFYTFADVGFSYTYDSAVNNLAVAGYLDTYDKYKTEFSVDLGDYKYGLVLNGPKLESIDILEKPTIDILSNSPQNFEFTSSQDFVRKHSYWEFTSGNQSNEFANTTLWYISSGDENGHRIGEIPQEIKDKLPLLNLESIALKRLTLYTKANTYEDQIEISTKTFVDQREELTEYVQVKF